MNHSNCSDQDTPWPRSSWTRLWDWWPQEPRLESDQFRVEHDPVFPFVHISTRFWSLVSSPLHISYYITFDNYMHRFLFIWLPKLYNRPLLPTYSPNEWLQEKSGFISLFRFKTSKNSGCPHKRASNGWFDFFLNLTFPPQSFGMAGSNLETLGST